MGPSTLRPLLDAAVQQLGDGGGSALVEHHVEPPVWLLLLIVPILLGGTVGIGATVRRLD